VAGGAAGQGHGHRSRVCGRDRARTRAQSDRVTRIPRGIRINRNGQIFVSFSHFLVVRIPSVLLRLRPTVGAIKIRRVVFGFGRPRQVSTNILADVGSLEKSHTQKKKVA
jgi:hypothetical protein